MMRFVPVLVGTAFVLSFASASAAMAQGVSSQAIDSFMQQYGQNGTLSLQQANKAASAHFDKLDTDHDGTVDQKEVVPAGVSTSDFTLFDVPDKDKLIQKDEYTNLVKQKFSDVDNNHNNALTKDELNSTAGQKLMQLLQ